MANVEHSSLTGTALHEPKGVASATSGQLYFANGTGSGAWTDNIALKAIATATNIRANSGTGLIPVDAAWSSVNWVNLGNISGTYTVDCSTGINFYGTLNGNITISFSNLKNGETVGLALLQDATGSRTVAWNSQVKWPGNTTPATTSTANAVALIGFFTNNWDSTMVFGSAWKLA